MSKSLKRFGVSMEPELLARLDYFVLEKGYQNRSQAIRTIVREALLNNSSHTNIVHLTITLLRKDIHQQFWQIIRRCEHWGVIHTCTTNFIGTSISLNFVLEINPTHLVQLKQDSVLQPLITYIGG